MKKMVYLHGFASSGASGTVEQLRRTFWVPDPAARVQVVPSLPLAVTAVG